MPHADWVQVFSLTVSPVELVARGSAIYGFLFLIFRFVLRRDVGSVGMADVLVLVIIADAAQNAMSGEYKSVPDGMVLIGTLVFWNLLLDWLAYRFPWLERRIEAGKLLLVRDGRVQHAGLRRELMTREDLMAKLREKGVERLAQVKRAYMESDGGISVIRRDQGASDGGSAGKPGAGGGT